MALQIVTLIVWCAGRFFLYTSYYSIFGALFGFTNFGRMVAIDNTINGLFGLLQLPLTNWGLHGLGGNFTAINIIQVSCTSLLCECRKRHTAEYRPMRAKRARMYLGACSLVLLLCLAPFLFSGLCLPCSLL